MQQGATKIKSNLQKSSIARQLATFDTITLAQMDKSRLMERTDVKYVGHISAVPKLLELAADNYRVQVIGCDRSQSYVTTYLDTIDLSMYAEHYNKYSFRQKIRVRTYLSANETYFEIKTNNNGCTKKQRIRIGTDGFWNGTTAVETFVAELSDYKVTDLHPSIVSEFRRITLVSNNMNERLTIDTDISFKNVRTGCEISLPNMLIVEQKCEKDRADNSVDTFQALHLERMGFSKYCVGVALTDSIIENKSFSRQLRKVEKLIGV